ncbi:MAG: methionine synthase [Leptolyngbyaceae cyanobacterium MO_188.B28]|nr:methionine synthase [Leptolyngbyaceae cyanobacterium MO_188.B28]
MNRGIYIVANDKVAENAIALLSSLRLHDPEIPVVLIPFNDDYQTVASTLAELYQVTCFPDLAFLEVFTQTISEIFPRDFLALPNKMRKLAAWFGPLEDFLYIDTDILVFEPISKTLDYLLQADFICCDFHHKGRGLKDVFSSTIQAQGIFSEDDLTDVFNSGFWGAKKGTISLEQMYELLRECAQHREYFDFSSGTTDQPIMNFLVLKSIAKRLNITNTNPHEPGSWAGSSHFREENHILYDGDRPLRYLHWAGTPMRAGGPYRSLWEYYRYLKQPRPISVSEATPNAPIWKKVIKLIKS